MPRARPMKIWRVSDRRGRAAVDIAAHSTSSLTRVDLAVTRRPMKWSLILCAVLLACNRAPAPPASSADAEEQRAVEAWRKRRLERLTSETGWLSLAGLYFLKEGAQTAGSAAASALRFPERAPRSEERRVG